MWALFFGRRLLNFCVLCVQLQVMCSHRSIAAYRRYQGVARMEKQANVSKGCSVDAQFWQMWAASGRSSKSPPRRLCCVSILSHTLRKKVRHPHLQGVSCNEVGLGRGFELGGVATFQKGFNIHARFTRLGFPEVYQLAVPRQRHPGWQGIDRKEATQN